MKHFRLLIGLLFVALGASANEHYVVQHYSIKDGMSQNTVMAIMQDKQGFMWFGTWDGLNRFDGYEFVTFKAMRNGEEAQVNNRVELIYEDDREQLWWETYDGHYYRLDAARQVTTEFPYDSLPEGMLLKMNEAEKHTKVDSRGVIWQTDDTYGILRTAAMPDDSDSISSSWRIAKDAHGSTPPEVDGVITITRKMNWSIRLTD